METTHITPYQAYLRIPEPSIHAHTLTDTDSSVSHTTPSKNHAADKTTVEGKWGIYAGLEEQQQGRVRTTGPDCEQRRVGVGSNKQRSAYGTDGNFQLCENVSWRNKMA